MVSAAKGDAREIRLVRGPRAGVWTKVKIDVRGEQARLYVHDQQQPTLIVNDLKTGGQGKGTVALWIDRGTVAHFRNLSVDASSSGISK